MSSFIESHSYVVTKKIISIFSIISIIIIILHHLIKIYLNPGAYKVHLYVKIIAYTILSSALVMGCYSAMVIFLITTPMNDSIITQSCYSQLFTTIIFYGINKSAMQYSYFLRLQISYKDSIFEINKFCIYTLYICTTIYFILIVIVYAQSNDDAFYYNSTYHICNNNLDSNSSAGIIIGGIVIFYEFIVSIMALALFLRPMFKLKIYDNMDDKILIFKVGLLNSIMIVSSLITAICFMLSRGIIFSLIDNVINSFCIILMFGIHDKLFRALCCIGLCCDIDGSENESNIAASYTKTVEMNGASSNSSASAVTV